MVEIREYETEEGGHPFRRWFGKLDVRAALKVTRALAQLEVGNSSATKSVGGGVQERKIDFGPGYRVYFGRDGKKLLILLAGGTKKRQPADVETAKKLWKEYKARKRRETS